MLEKLETCLYCAAPVQASPDAGFVRCQSCGRVMEVTRFTREERRLTEAVDEAKASAERAAEELRQCMNALGASQQEEKDRAVEADRACRQALKQVTSRLECSEARQMRSIYIQAENAQRAGRFKDAENRYRRLLEYDDSEAEIHWRLVLCRYGVEYVCEQASGRYLPTICHMVVDSVLENADYQAAARCAGSEALRAHYESEALAIDAILEKYRQIRATEKPYDVFISVKQGDANGNPTKDSFTAQKLQYELQSRLGLHVFNSRSSLEGHAGTEFEPYIMAALMSAKVMVVVSSRAEYINAPWVRNEWRRFRWLKDNQSGDRRLIVFLTGMSVRDVPAAMGDLQAISNTDAEPVKDLIGSVQEAFGGRRPRQDSSNLLELASIELEYDGFDKANEYCGQALYREPRNARAYALQLCAEKKVRSIEALSQLDQPLDDCVNYQKAIRFADEAFRQTLLKCNQDILDRAAKRDFTAAEEELARIGKARPASVAEAKQLAERCTELCGVFRAQKTGRDGAELERRCREQRDRLERAGDQLARAQAAETLDALEGASPKSVQDARDLAGQAGASAETFRGQRNGSDSAQAEKHSEEPADRVRSFRPDVAQDAEKKSVREEMERLRNCAPDTQAEANALLKALAELEKRCTANAGFTYEERVNLKSEIIDLRKRFERARAKWENLEKRAEEAVRELENRLITTRAEALQFNRDIAALKEEYDDFRRLPGGDDLLRRCDRLTIAVDRDQRKDDGHPTREEMQAARDALDAMESRWLVNGKQAQKLVGDVDALISRYNGFAGFPDRDELLNVRCAALRKRFSDISEDLEKKRLAREAVDEFERRTVTNRAEALQFSGEIQQLVRAQDDFSAFPDGAKLRARCGDLLTRCTQYLSEGTGERQPPKFSAQEQRAWKELERLEAQAPAALGEIVDLDEQLRMLSSEHGNFWGYCEGALLKARVAAKRTAIAEDAAKIVDGLFKGFEKTPVSEARAAAHREQLKQISSTCRDFELMPEAKRTAFRRRYRELLAQCDQPAKGEEDKPKKKGFSATDWLGLAMCIGGEALIGWALQSHGMSRNFALLTGVIIVILVLAFEKLLCGKKIFSSERGLMLKLGSTVALTGLLYLMVSNMTNLPREFSAAPEHNFRNFLIAAAMCIYTLISTLEMFGKKKNGRGCIAAAMCGGLVYYLVWFLS